MKEATGELNATVVVVVAVGVLSAFFYLTIWPMIKSNQEHVSNCKKAICNKQSNGDGTVDCYYCDHGTPVDIVCSWKNVPSKDGDSSVKKQCN